MVSALAKMLRDKSTDGVLSSHGGKVEIDEVKMSFCLKPIADKSVFTRRPRGRIWLGRLSSNGVVIQVKTNVKHQYSALMCLLHHLIE